MARRYPPGFQLGHCRNGFSNPPFIGFDQVKPADHAIEEHTWEKLHGIPENIDNPRMAAARDHDNASAFNMNGNGRIIRKEVFGEFAIHRCNRFDAWFFKIRPARDLAESGDAFHQRDGISGQKEFCPGLFYFRRSVSMRNSDVAQARPPGEMRSEDIGMGYNGKIPFPHRPDKLRKVTGVIVMAMRQHDDINHLRTQTQSVHIVKEHFGGLSDVYENIPYFLSVADLEKKGGPMLGDEVARSGRRVIHEHKDFQKFHTAHLRSAPFGLVISRILV